MSGLIGHGLDVANGSGDIADTDRRRVDILRDFAGGRGLLFDRSGNCADSRSNSRTMVKIASMAAAERSVVL
jgi:hypothetical protein